ncbi:SusC/RagA family TonB-linked outer membrane protein [Pedobacter nyackensis]|uniref:TonB-linked outer membrane protein, SusC/RagA family n=1 Tax=Pedobacter nyackensis TaxID=475255 RepID=A0A1W2A337_9SPHI|nr:SusC/RagA family TonB-linked outer membrane protein [Pedobacter nyackensis]SMC54862.1 TonB-linked outer membrane protein, SusC/RagA family [Pedobacter nyackensis]
MKFLDHIGLLHVAWLPNQFVRIMRLTIIMITMALMQVSAAGLAQKVSLHFKNVPLEQVLIAVKQQTAYNFVYTEDVIAKAKRVSINLKDADLKDALMLCFENQPLNFTIEQGTIVIKAKEPSFLDKVVKRLTAIDVRGIVVDEKGAPLVGATVKVKGTEKKVVTNGRGEFYLQYVEEKVVLVISYLGYESIEMTAAKDLGTIRLKLVEGKLDEVEVVSTGYQNIPKERATGSFTLLDNELLNRRVSTNILDRIDGIASGVIFNKGIIDGSNKSDITIHGRSTIFANPNPLIVLDNFPYDGDLSNINPNDIESVTILKDAAAASIWGVRAGNGVIVLTTKKGKRDSKPILDFNSNLSVTEKPDLWYPYQMTSSEYIELEKFLYDKGRYKNALLNNTVVVSPAVTLMDKLKKNLLTTDQYNEEISKLQQHDVKRDLNKYFYRNPFRQQYNLNISGGNATQKYYLSGGFDRNNNSQVANNYNRYTINANNTFNFFKDKLELFTGLTLTKSKSENMIAGAVYTPYTPYDQLADKNGNALAIVNVATLGVGYTDALGTDQLLDWHYRPMDERTPNNVTNAINYRLLTGISYKVLPSLKAELNYQHEEGSTDRTLTNSKNSYYTRDMINRFTSVNQATGVVTRIIPHNDIVNQWLDNYRSQYMRLQLNFQKKIAGRHDVNAIAGYEFKDYSLDNTNQTYYGYDPVTKSNVNGTIDPLKSYPLYYNTSLTQRIGTSPSQSGSIDRAISFYANASYGYDRKYILSLSARKDETNIFGVKSNQKGVPLWSAGLSWIISNEAFYHLDYFSDLKLRATYGYNGNVDKTLSAYLTSQIAGSTLIGTDFSQVVNPPNPSLGWEKVKNINFGLDFSTKGNWLRGSIDYYVKNGEDLIGESPIAPQTGVLVFKGNSANTQTRGIDFTANIKALSVAQFRWDINALYSYSRDKVTEYKKLPAINGDLVFENYRNPLVGYPYYSVFAFKYAGLNNSGNPLGYLDGETSTDYASIYNSLNRDDVKFMGSGTPTSFGSIRNTFFYKDWSLSLNIIFKLGYYFQRTNVFTGDVYSYRQGDYGLRWKNPGDESRTRIPSLVYPADGLRGILYQGSDDLVEKGDHIRLQDIRISYKLTNNLAKYLPFKSLEAYSYVNNIGILWRANKKGIDPDAGTQLIPSAKSISVGLNATF